MSWPVLFVAGPFEVAWVIGLVYSDGLSRPLPTAGTVLALAASMVLLARAVETLPTGTAYAVRTGVGAVGTAVLGVVLFDEPATLARVASSPSSSSASSACTRSPADTERHACAHDHRYRDRWPDNLTTEYRQDNDGRAGIDAR